MPKKIAKESMEESNAVAPKNGEFCSVMQRVPNLKTEIKKNVTKSVTNIG